MKLCLSHGPARRCGSSRRRTRRVVCAKTPPALILTLRALAYWSKQERPVIVVASEQPATPSARAPKVAAPTTDPIPVDELLTASSRPPPCRCRGAFVVLFSRQRLRLFARTYTSSTRSPIRSTPVQTETA